jgi:hypothetical protein
MVTETALPDWELQMPLGSYRVSRTSFYQLHRPFKRGRCRRSQQDGKVVGHEHKFVHSVSSLSAISKETFNEEQTHGFRDEEAAALPRARRNEVRARHASVALWNSHALSG